MRFKHPFRIGLSAGRDSDAVQQPDHVVARFEGLGDGCEFGIVQRVSGIEPLGLLRFTSLPYDKLLTLLDTDFADLASPDEVDLKLLPGDDEWWGHIPRFGMQYHTGHSSERVSREKQLAAERVRIPFLTRKLREDLAQPTKVFVRCDIHRSLDEIRRGFAALRRHGPHALLWVTETDRDDLVGTVEWLETGLVRGYVGHFQPNAIPTPASLAMWLTMARETLRLLGMPLDPAQPTDPSRRLEAPSWVWDPRTRLDFKSDEVEPRGDRPVTRHELHVGCVYEQACAISVAVDGIEPNRLYTFSLWIFLPTGFDGGLRVEVDRASSIWLWQQFDDAVRGRWQRLVLTVRVDPGKQRVLPHLLVYGPAGSVLYTADWRFERGACPMDADPVREVQPVQFVPPGQKAVADRLLSRVRP